MSTPERPWWVEVNLRGSTVTRDTFPVALRPYLDADQRARLDDPGCTDTTAGSLARRAQYAAWRLDQRARDEARRAAYRERQAARLAAMTPEELADREKKLAARRKRDRARRAQRDKEFRRWLRGGAPSPAR